MRVHLRSADRSLGSIYNLYTDIFYNCHCKDGILQNKRWGTEGGELVV